MSSIDRLGPRLYIRALADWRPGLYPELMMSPFDFFMTPAQARAFRAVGLLSASHACHLAMKWLEAGSESVAVAAMAIEDGSYVAWADISTLFQEAMAEAEVNALTQEEEHALRLHALLVAFLNREVAAVDFWWVAGGLPIFKNCIGFELSDARTEQVYLLALEYMEIEAGNVFSGRPLSAVFSDLRHEAGCLRMVIEATWACCNVSSSGYIAYPQ